MRLKQLLVVLLPLLVLASVAACAVTPELTNVAVVGQGNTTTVTLRASGAFTHTEYRPADDLLLINLQGLSAGKLQDRAQELQTAGVKSYRVFGFTAADGSQIARVELKLAAKADIRVNEGKDELVVELLSSGVAPASVAAAAPVSAPAVSGPAELRQVRVAQGATGVEIQLFTTQPVTAKTMKLTRPNRLVIDLPAGVLASVPRVLSVNQGDVRSVRVGRFQQRPPVTRVVVDLKAARDFDLVADGTNLTLKPRVLAGSNSAAAPADSAASKVPASKLAKAGDADSESKGGGKSDPASFVLLEPKVQERTGNSPDPAPAPASTASSNALAAALQQAAAPVPQTQSQPQATVPSAVQPAVNFAAEQRRQTGPGAPLGPKYTGEPISVRLKDADVRDFFLMISELSGLNIFVDPSITGSLTLVLNDVPWDQALDIVLKSNGLDRQLEGNVLRIASIENLRKEAEGRRKQQEAEALAVQKVTNTRFLSYAHSKDVLPTIKRLLSARGEAVADDRTNALIIDDIPNVMPAIDTLIAQLDRKTQEVEIEARVVAATRTFIRSIGTQLGFGFGNSATAVGGAPAVGNSPATVGYIAPPGYITSPAVTAAKAGAPTSASIPLFSNLGVEKATSGLSLINLGANYRVDAILTASEQRGLLKILSRPRAITQNNIQAIVKQGQRIPITTRSQLDGPPTVTYIDALLRLTVTPQITAENTIFLNIDIENTSPDYSNMIQGNPVFLTEQITTSVLVTNGGTAVIGGVMQSSNSTNVDQVPLLGNIPGVGNLFKRRSVNTNTQELFFFITPRIVET